MDCGVLVGAWLIRTVSGKPGVGTSKNAKKSSSEASADEDEWYESGWWASFCFLLLILTLFGLLLSIAWKKRGEIKEGRRSFKKKFKRSINRPVKHNGTLIFLHAIGDSGDGWKAALKALRPPHVKIICPTAKKIPVTLNSGFKMPAWFDLTTYEPTGIEDEAGIKKAVEVVNKIIEEEIEIGIPSERIVIGGFSQGGALAFYTALHTKYKLGGVTGLSCWIPLHNDVQSGATHATHTNVGTPFMQFHGETDGVVSSGVGLSTSNLLKKMVKNHEFKIYKSLAHETSEEEVQDLMQFVSSCLPTIDPYADA